MGHKMFFGFAEHVKVMSTLHCSLFSIMSKKKNHDTYLNLEISLKNANHHLTMQDATITSWEAHTHTHTSKVRLAGDAGLIPGLARSPGERNGNPL